MRLALKFLFVLALALTLTGCGDPDPDTAAVPAPDQTAPAQPAAPQRAEPADAPPAALEPATEQEPEALIQARAKRDRLRAGRGGELRWWDDDTLVAQLGLDPDQRGRLLEARSALDSARQTDQARLRELRGQIRPTGDAQRLAELQTSVAEIRERLVQADRGWQDTVHEMLSPTQRELLDDLIEPQP